MELINNSTYNKLKILNNNKNIFTEIAEILRNIGNKACLEKATFLEHASNNKSLHLRGLELGPLEALKIAKALKETQTNGVFQISSISFSNNHSLGDQGAIALLNALPLSIHELGLVNCGIGDVGGEELLAWVSNTSNLQMVCAEKNNFSDSIKMNFRKFSIEHPEITVVV